MARSDTETQEQPFTYHDPRQHSKAEHWPTYGGRILRELQETPCPDAVKDPMPAMIVACGRLLTWYSNVQRPSMTYKMILANQQEGVAVLQCLQDTFPVRNTSLKQWMAHVFKRDSLDS